MAQAPNIYIGMFYTNGDRISELNVDTGTPLHNQRPVKPPAPLTIPVTGQVLSPVIEVYLTMFDAWETYGEVKLIITGPYPNRWRMGWSSAECEAAAWGASLTTTDTLKASVQKHLFVQARACGPLVDVATNSPDQDAIDNDFTSHIKVETIVVKAM